MLITVAHLALIKLCTWSCSMSWWLLLKTMCQVCFDHHPGNQSPTPFELIMKIMLQIKFNLKLCNHFWKMPNIHWITSMCSWAFVEISNKWLLILPKLLCHWYIVHHKYRNNFQVLQKFLSNKKKCKIKRIEKKIKTKEKTKEAQPHVH